MALHPHQPRPLAGLKVVEFAHVVAGPFTGTGRLIETDALPLTGTRTFFRLRVGS